MILIKNGTVHDAQNSPRISDILIEGEKIARVSPEITMPDARVIDARGMHVLPGFIDPATPVGSQDITFKQKDHEELSSPVNIDADIRYSFNPNEIMLEALYETGVTTIGACPGNTNVIGGRCAVYTTYGYNSTHMLVQSFSALKGSVAAYAKREYGARLQTPMTKMGIFSLLDNALQGEHKGLKKETMDAVLSGQVPFFVHAESEVEVRALLHALAPYPHIRLVLTGAYQSHRCIDALLERGAAIIIGELVEMSRGMYSGTDLQALRAFTAGGGLLTFSGAGGSGARGKLHYLWNAARYRQAGFSSLEVLRMMTLNPARLLGIDDRKGTLEPGKDADITIFSHDPVNSYAAFCRYTLVGGELACERRRTYVAD